MMGERMLGMTIRTAVAVVAALALSGFGAAVALASPPPNDNFADREDLGATLPVEETRSNVEATREEGEPWLGFGSGHTVWFEWEAPASGWVTVSGCSSEFTSLVGIYEGDSLMTLTDVAPGNTSEGPGGCPSGSGGRRSFHAEAGEAYEIVVDSSGFYLPEKTPPPTTVGSFELRLEATPPPPNDDFADAAVLDGRSDEEPDGTRRYFAVANGYTWGATKESEEPEHGGDPGGASVWYSWTAPESGIAQINPPCCTTTGLVALYEGDSLAALEPVATGGVFPFVGYSVLAGETYWIAVDGAYDESTGLPASGSFSLLVSMELAPGPGYSLDGGGGAPAIPDPLPLPTPTPADTQPPKTKIAKRKIIHRKRTAVFRFRSSEPGGRFLCKLDRGRFRNCRSPRAYRHLRPARHVFKVVAVDAAGNRDRSPAVARFRVKRMPH